MAETIVSPGVLTIENDQSFITQAPVQAGAAIIGPTPKGKVGIPTLCTTYSDYTNKYGTTFLSGGQSYTYLTSISAYNYFNNGGTALLVTRVVSGSTATAWTPATSSFIPSSTAATSASASLDLTYISASVAAVGSSSFDVNNITFYFTGSTVANTSTVIYINTASFADSTLASYAVSSSATFNISNSISPYNSSLQYISSSASSPNIVFTYVGSNGLIGNLQYITSGSTTTYFSGGTNTEAFVLETLAEGNILNSVGPTGSNDTLLSGSANNYRWQILSPNTDNGTFTLLIRQGNDSSVQPSILETWGPLSLDPFSPNYIEKVIGNQYETIGSDNGEYFVQLNGEYPNVSNYVRVKQVNLTTPNYFDNLGLPKSEYTGSLPTASQGVFGDGKGDNIPVGSVGMYYENITNTSIQGLTANDYTESISLLANKDAYKYNFITAPGLIADNTFSSHIPVVTQLVNMVTERTDTMTVIDLVKYGSQINSVLTNNARTLYDNSYVATYWPWTKTIDPNTATQRWVPVSTMIPGVYAKNDSISYPWFAPAGINRGIMTNVLSAERFLTQGNRDSLYQANVNPIATFPNTGVTVFGQKTLQKKQSALDRVNVRRLLIELKNYISQVANTYVFEQNDVATRNEFSSIISSYLSTVQNNQGLISYQVIMNETNNTPTVIDNNQLVGQIYLQPTKTAEFIILDFNILPTGAVFPS
jgi:hypothetical protein